MTDFEVYLSALLKVIIEIIKYIQLKRVVY